MSTQYKILIGDTATPQARVPKTGVESYLAPVTLDAATGNEVAFDIQYTTNKLTSGNDTGLLINQTDTASPGTSLPLDIQKGGVSLTNINNAGQLRLDAAGTFGATTGLMFGDGDAGFYEASDDVLSIDLAGVNYGIFKVQQFQWSAAALDTSSPSAIVPNILPQYDDVDTGIGRAAADQLSLIAGGVESMRISETANVITTDIDAGDNAAGNIGALTSVKSAIATVSSSAAATLTASGLIPAGCFLIGITARITTTFGNSTGLTDFDVGDGVDVDRFANSLAITSGTTMNLTNATAAPSGSFAAANDVVLTAVGGNFDGDGVIELIAHFIDLTAPTG